MFRFNLAQLQAALGFLTRLPLDTKKASAGGGGGPLALALAAGLVGLAASLAAWLFHWLAGPVAGALLGGVLVPVSLWWLTRGRGLQALLAVARGGDGEDESGSHADEFLLRSTGFQAALLLKLVCAGLLIGAGAGLWFFVAWMVTGAVFADELAASLASRREQSLLRGGHWPAAAIAVVVAGGLLGQFVGALFVLVLAWLAVPVVRRWLGAHVDLRGVAFAWLFAEATETAVLLLATLLVFAS
jgi:hypothetical protein